MFRLEYYKVKNGSQPAEIFSVNETEETNAVQAEMIANGDVSMKFNET